MVLIINIHYFWKGSDFLGVGVDKRCWVHPVFLEPPKFRAGFRTQAVDEMDCLGRKKR